MNRISQNTESIKQKAHELGFARIGIAKAEPLTEDASRLRDWLDNKRHATMQWMENWLEKRIDPRELVPGAKSVIVVTYNYYSDDEPRDPQAPKVARYARGKDYHFVLKEKLNSLLDFIRAEIGDVSGRAFVDSAPVLERAWAVRAGVGWIGKNSLLLHPEDGSYHFLGELIVDLELEYDEPMADRCGSCTMCMTSCPTEAIIEPRVVDARRCISYWTIEHRGDLPEVLKKRISNWVFGCDICQDVCPFNRDPKPHEEPAFEPKEELLKLSWTDWQNLDKPTYNRLFKGTAVTRTRYQGLRRNIDFLGPVPPELESPEAIEQRRQRAREILKRRPGKSSPEATETEKN